MYGAFAHVYDKFMENTPYDEWIMLIEKIWAEYGLVNDSRDLYENVNKLILELGCGTGNVTQRLAEKGYDMIGIDSSQDMLSVAIQKKQIATSSTKGVTNRQNECDDKPELKQKDEIIMELSNNHVDEMITEPSSDHLDEIIAEQSNDHVKEIIAELSNDHVDEITSEPSNDHVYQITTEPLNDHTDQITAESLSNHPDQCITEQQGIKNNSLEKDILYLCQDMRSFELYGTVDSIICICDGINYLTKSSDVAKVFRLVKNYLNPGGIFIFDIITRYRYSKILGENNFSETNETSAFIWDNYFDKDSGINRYSVSFFIQNKNGLYERFDEMHYQRAYGKKKLIRLLDEAGLELLNIYDESGEAEKPKSERLFFAARNNK